MMRFPLMLLLWVAFCQLATGETLRIATYNVRNYLETNRWIDGRYRGIYPKPEDEKEALRSVLLQVRPDVLILQEMGPEAYLLELQSDLRAEGLEFPHRYLAEAADPDRHVALLSRLEPVELRTHDDLHFVYMEEEIPVKRGLMEAVFKNNGLHWKVYGLHLKSKWSDYDADPGSDQRRRSEALAVRRRIIELKERDGLPFIVGGDFNDTKGTAPVRLLQKRGKTEVVRLLDAFDSREERWTHYYSKEDEYRRVDYLFISPKFPAAVKNDRGHIHDGPDALLASDHRLVWIDLVWEKDS